jgi:hypothetical protein
VEPFVNQSQIARRFRVNQKKSAEKAQSSFASQMEERIREIELAAYRKAERRGFTPGHEVEDWLEAEREIDEEALSVS